MSERRFMAGFSVENPRVWEVARIVDGKAVAHLDGPNAAGEAQQLAEILNRAVYVTGDPPWRQNLIEGGWSVGEVDVVWAHVLNPEDRSYLRKLFSQPATFAPFYHLPILRVPKK